MMRMIASAGTILIPLLALVDDISCVTVAMLSSMGKPVLLLPWLWMN
jgi:hypothetical protein